MLVRLLMLLAWMCACQPARHASICTPAVLMCVFCTWLCGVRPASLMHTACGVQGVMRRMQSRSMGSAWDSWRDAVLQRHQVESKLRAVLQRWQNQSATQALNAWCVLARSLNACAHAAALYAACPSSMQANQPAFANVLLERRM